MVTLRLRLHHFLAAMYGICVILSFFLGGGWGVRLMCRVEKIGALRFRDLECGV